MKKLFTIFLLAFLFIPTVSEARRGCCSWHGGVSHCGSYGYYICNDGTESPSCTCSAPTRSSYYYQPATFTNSEYKNAFCDIKYPGTIYRPLGDKCVCPNGKPFDEKIWQCPVETQTEKNAKCNIKYPGTIYRATDDKCVCPNAKPFNEKARKCPT